MNIMLRALIMFAALGCLSTVAQATHDSHWLQEQKPGFEENLGQVSGKDANRVKFRLNTGSVSIFLLDNAISYQFLHVERGSEVAVMGCALGQAIKGADYSTHRMDMQLIGANLNPRISKIDAQNHYTRYSRANLEKAASDCNLLKARPLFANFVLLSDLVNYKPTP